MDINLVSRFLLSLLFLVSGYKSATGDIEGSVNYVKSVNWPFARLSVILATILKMFVSYSLLTNNYLQYSIIR